MYEENQGKIFKTYSNMFATLKTTLGERSQANHEKIGICDHFGKQHNQGLLNGCLWILSTHQSSRLACTPKWFHKSLPRQLVTISLPSWNVDSQLTLALKRPFFLWFIDLTLVKILTNGEILHERLLNLTTAALMCWGCKLLKGCYWLFIECILGWSCRANFLSLWNI